MPSFLFTYFWCWFCNLHYKTDFEIICLFIKLLFRNVNEEQLNLL